MSEVDLVEVRELHIRIPMADAGGEDYCDKCLQPWPCDAIRLADETEARRSAMAKDHKAMAAYCIEMKRLRAENERQAEALGFYADEEKYNYQRDETPAGEPIDILPIVNDRGRIARAALHPEASDPVGWLSTDGHGPVVRAGKDGEVGGE